MFLDKETLLCNEQVFTVAAVSENACDAGGADGLDIGAGEPVGIGIVPVETATGAGPFEFRAIQSATNALGAPDILASRSIPAAAMTAGSCHVIQIPAGTVTKQFIGMSFSGTGNVKVKAWVAPLSFFGRWKAHKSGWSIF